MALDDLYREVILQHYKSPRLKGELEEPTLTVEAANPLCGDEMALDLKLSDDTLTDIRWHGIGCSISLASASMMAELVRGKDIQTVRHYIDRFKGMMRSENEGEELGELIALQGVARFPVRIKCAELAWAALEDGLDRAAAHV